MEEEVKINKDKYIKQLENKTKEMQKELDYHNNVENIGVE